MSNFWKFLAECEAVTTCYTCEYIWNKGSVTGSSWCLDVSSPSATTTANCAFCKVSIGNNTVEVKKLCVIHYFCCRSLLSISDGVSRLARLWLCKKKLRDDMHRGRRNQICNFWLQNDHLHHCGKAIDFNCWLKWRHDVQNDIMQA